MRSKLAVRTTHRPVGGETPPSPSMNDDQLSIGNRNIGNNINSNDVGNFPKALSKQSNIR